MKTFTPYLEILPEAQKYFWKKLSPCKDLGFVLYGGTAIALQLGHRISIDFDFFSHFPLDKKKEEELLTALPFLKDARLVQSELNSRSYITSNKVQFSFFGDIRLGRINEPRNTEDGVLQIASLDDLMALKLVTVMKRIEAKDYQDIAAMLRNGIDLEKGLGGAVALYGKQFSPSESVRTLTYFQGGDLENLSMMDRNTLLHATQNLLLHALPRIEKVSESLTLENG